MSDSKSNNRLSDASGSFFASPVDADSAITEFSITDEPIKPCTKSRHISSNPPKYIKLNIGGRLYITTFETICSADWMISRMLKSEIPSIKDEDGFITVDRCGTYFEYFLEFLREGQVELPSNYKILSALLVEARFYCFQEFCQLIESKLIPKYHHVMQETYIINVQCPEHLYRVIKNTTKPIICLTLNRSNNKYSYVEKADDNFVRHNELFHRLNSRFQGIADFVIDTGSDQYEVCTWRFFSADGEKRAEISCASIVYTPDRKQTKVDFPEARIYEEALNALLRHCGVATYKEMPIKKDGTVMLLTYILLTTILIYIPIGGYLIMMIPLRPKSSPSPSDRCIKVLLDAERRGNQRIAEAQAYRVKMLKQGRIDAEIEINAYRKQKDDKIKEKLQQIDTDIEKEKIVYDRQVDATIKEYEERVAQVKDRIIENLLGLVMDIKPEIHHNFKLRKELEETG